ncbi:MAG: multidrug efflux pump subunit AcrB, partial [Alteromonadaceae bacterium]
QINIQTFWRAASPKEIESEIIEPQEEVLQGLPGLTSLRTFANAGAGFVNLEFDLNTDMQKILIEVISRMNRLPPLPREVNAPRIDMGGGGNALIYFFLQALPGNDVPVSEYTSYFDDTIRPRIESIAGVASVQLQSGGGAQQMEIVFDPYQAAALGIEINQVAGLLGSANDVSGGSVDVGRRAYTLRFAGRYQPEKMGEMILQWRDGKPIKLADIATINITRDSSDSIAVQNGNPAMSVRIDKENGANVLKTLEKVKDRIAQINSEQLQAKNLVMVQSFDASVFIYRAISLVFSNLVLGILLAVGILWLFLRQGRATMIVALAIPISVLSTFVVLKITGRSLNVISLAGLAFAVGMVLDAAIVVLENIVRLRQNGENEHDAAQLGTSQVLGALLASTATTIAIFIPVMFLGDVAGQLFADLALTIAIAVFISFLVAITILPAVAKKYLSDCDMDDKLAPLWHKITQLVMVLTATGKKRLMVIGTMMTVPVLASVVMMPNLDYLPPVKRDAVDAFFNFPAGANNAFKKNEVVDVVVKRLQPYMDGTLEPALKNYYFLTFPNGGTIGVRAKDQGKVKELERIIRDEILKDLPDTQTFAQQGNLFGGFGGRRSIDIHLQGADTQAIAEVARKGMELLNKNFPGANVRPNPSLEQSEPELRLTPDDRRISEVGYTRASVAQLVRSLGDGLYVGEHFDGNKRLDIIFKSQGWDNPEELASLPVATPSGALVRLGDLVEVKRTVGPSRIQRIDGKRTLTLSLSPPEDMSLQEAMNIIKADIEPTLIGMLPPDGSINYGGSADALKGAISNMSENFILALGLLFVLMAGLFRSLKDSLLVVLSIPLATVGGVAAIQLLNLVTFQPLDLLTMIGFIILLGLVVNNAILLVHQTRSGERAGASRTDAVRQALQLRLRPIFMSTATSLFGMLPLLLMPGAGSVIYRGLAAVIVGGMSVSTLFTLILLPAFLRMGEAKKQHLTDEQGEVMPGQNKVLSVN